MSFSGIPLLSISATCYTVITSNPSVLPVPASPAGAADGCAWECLGQNRVLQGPEKPLFSCQLNLNRDTSIPPKECFIFILSLKNHKLFLLFNSGYSLEERSFTQGLETPSHLRSLKIWAQCSSQTKRNLLLRQQHLTAKTMEKYIGNLFLAISFFHPSAFEGSLLVIQGTCAVGFGCWIAKVILKCVFPIEAH